MMRMEVRSVHLPRWITPLLILAALALIPFALMLALALVGIVLGVSALRFFLAGPLDKKEEFQRVEPKVPQIHLSSCPVIDVDYEVKEEK
jgi:hypothetical protein